MRPRTCTSVPVGMTSNALSRSPERVDLSWFASAPENLLSTVPYRYSGVTTPPARILSLEPASQSVAGTRVWKGVADGSVTVGGGRWAKWSTALKIQ